jgi:integrase
MKGTIVQRYKGTWSLIIDLGYQSDPATGTPKRKQKWITVKGTKRDAQDRLNELLRDVRHAEFVEPSKRTLGQWLTEWLEVAVKPAKRPRTYDTYKSIINGHLLPSTLAGLRLQTVKSQDVERYYLEKAKVTDTTPALSLSTLGLHHAILHGALKAAQRADLVVRNVSELVNGKPRARKSQAAQRDCWDSVDAQSFLATVKIHADAQWAAFYKLALDSGARKAELVGLDWKDVSLDTAKITIRRQLAKPGPTPVFGPPKNGKSRTIDITPGTVQLLAAHRRHQAEVKMANRATYHELGLVFAKDWPDATCRRDQIGDPLSLSHVGQKHFKRLVTMAAVKPITFHGLRHTMATLLLQAGTPARVVQERLGHEKIAITLEIYGHVLPSMQQDAAAKLEALLG